MTHPTPTECGYYWAFLVTPRDEPDQENWVSIEFEVVHVDEDYGGSADFRVYVPGIAVTQPIDAFEWGPRVPDFEQPNVIAS